MNCNFVYYLAQGTVLLHRYAQKDDVLDLAVEMPGARKARVKLRGVGQASAVLPWHFCFDRRM